MKNWMSSLRLTVSSAETVWNVTGRRNAFANAAVMMTRDRQFPDRAAKACAAFRVMTESYSILSCPSRYIASTRPSRAPLLESCPAISTLRKCSISGLSAKTSSALMRSEGGTKRRSLNNAPLRGANGALAHATSNTESSETAQPFIWRLLLRGGGCINRLILAPMWPR